MLLRDLGLCGFMLVFAMFVGGLIVGYEWALLCLFRGDYCGFVCFLLVVCAGVDFVGCLWVNSVASADAFGFVGLLLAWVCCLIASDSVSCSGMMVVVALAWGLYLA